MSEVIAVRARYWFDITAKFWLAIGRGDAPPCVGKFPALWQERSYAAAQTYRYEYTGRFAPPGLRMASTYDTALEVIAFINTDTARVVGIASRDGSTGNGDEGTAEACAHAMIALRRRESTQRRHKMQQRDDGRRVFGTSDGRPRAGSLSDAEQQRRLAALRKAQGLS